VCRDVYSANFATKIWYLNQAGVVFANAEANESVKDDLRARAFLYTLVRPETYLAVS
jgi:hypothetical protein